MHEPLGASDLLDADGQLRVMGTDFRDLDLALLGYVARVMRRSFETRLGDYGLSSVQAIVLTYLHDHPGESFAQSEIADRNLLRKAAVGIAIDHLEGRGIATRSDDTSDRRVKLVRLTDKGIALGREVNRMMDQVNAGIRGAIEPAELRRFAETLLKIQDNLRAMQPPVAQLREPDPAK